MGKRYLHIGINWKGPAKTQEVQRLIEAPGNADDWLSYGGNCWIVFTPHDQKAWSDYLRSQLGPDDSLIVCEIANLSQSDGHLPQTLWEWFNRIRY